MTVSLIRGIAGRTKLSCLLLHEPRLIFSTNFPAFENSYLSFSTKPNPQKHDTEHTKDKTNLQEKYSKKGVEKTVKSYVFDRYINYVKNYDKLLEKKFPQAVTVYRTFFDGVRDFLKDMKDYLKITRILIGANNGLEALTRQELELYLRLPQQMLKIAPTLLFTALPVVGYLILPLAYKFPRLLLTPHFWNIQQKSEFQMIYFKERLLYNRKNFRFLQAKLSNVKKDPLYYKWKIILGQLGSGLHPSPQQIIDIRELFSHAPYQLNSLSSNNLKSLCKMHGISSFGLFRRRRLIEYAYILHNMDRAIRREGNVHNMTSDALKAACILRGLNASNLSNDDMINWLRQWVQVSLCIQEDHISLYLNLPILLGYNHPNNWVLIH